VPVICLPGQLGLQRVMALRRMIMEPIILLWFVFFLVMAFIMRRSMGEEG
jgi:hypothetical protein